MRRGVLRCAIAFALPAAVAVCRAAEGECRYWDRFRPINESGAYVSGVARDGGFELWKEVRLSTNRFDLGIVVKQGRVPEELGAMDTVFRAGQITDIATPTRNFSRTSVHWFPGYGYVALLCTLEGEYLPGRVPLRPALAISPGGRPETWRYHGHLPGDPSEMLPPGRKSVWSDGGGVERLADGRWRVYLNGYGVTLAAAEADRIEGPWRFLRDDAGKVRELAGALPVRDAMRGGAPFPAVLQVGPREWHAWFSDQWPVRAIWHLWSEDGLAWRLYGEQPEITGQAFGDVMLKCLRPYVDERGERIGGLLSVWAGGDDGRWMLWHATMPTGAPARVVQAAPPGGHILNRSGREVRVAAEGKAWRLAPGRRSPTAGDADGVRGIGEAISGYDTWWKIPNGATAEIVDGEGGLEIRGLAAWRADETTFGRRMKYMDDTGWGEAIDVGSP